MTSGLAYDTNADSGKSCHPLSHQHRLCGVAASQAIDPIGACRAACVAMHNTSILLSNKDRRRVYKPVKNTVLLGSEEYLGFSVAGSNLGLFIAESPLTIFTSFCNKNTQNEFL